MPYFESRILPDDLKIPPMYTSSPMEFDDWEAVRIFVDEKTNIPCIETKRGIKKIWKAEDIFNNLEGKHTVTICDPGVFDSLLRWLQPKELRWLLYDIPAKLKSGLLYYRGNSLMLTRSARNRQYLWNIIRFFTFEQELLERVSNDIVQIEAFTDLLLDNLNKRGIGFVSLSSPSSISRFLLSQYAYTEFRSNKMDADVLKAFYQAARGARHESAGIGSIQCYNYDMNKAHLNILALSPTIRHCAYRKGGSFTKEASYGAYLITADIPEMVMPPLPVTMDDMLSSGVAYPYGEISGWYSKPHIEILNELGIKYKIRESHQYIPVGTSSTARPFSAMVSKIRDFMDNSPWYINSKGLYHGIAGSTISHRPALNPDTGEVFSKSFNVFSPLIYGHVLATQGSRVYSELNKGGAIAIRADAVTVENRINTTLRLEDSGVTTFYTSLYKSFPSGKGDIWKTLIEKYRDSETITYWSNGYPSLWKAVSRDIKLGKIISGEVRLKPSHGFRKGKYPAKVGELLDKWFPSMPMSVEDIKAIGVDKVYDIHNVY